MDFKYYLTEQIRKHPSMMPEDVAKVCYQAAMGAEHLLMDVSAAKRYFDAEFDATQPREGELYECLSDEICRVDLGVWKKKGLPKEKLFDMFVRTATVKRGGKETLEKYLSEAEEVISDGNVAFTLDAWREFFEDYKAAGMPAIHHGDVYRQREKPAYRIVGRAFISELL